MKRSDIYDKLRAAGITEPGNFLAHTLGVSPKTVYAWKLRPIPEMYRAAVDKMLAGPIVPIPNRRGRKRSNFELKVDGSVEVRPQKPCPIAFSTPINLWLTGKTA